MLDECVTDFEAAQPLLQQLLKRYGSERRMMAAYWAGELSIEEEREIESRIPWEQRAAGKPCD